MADTVLAIKERLGIAEVIGSYIKLEKAGINFKARCPFHNEKTPSFFVSTTRNGFYCFGCGEKGDIFSFVEKFEGVDFKGALKILAERAGVPLVYERNAQSRDDREALFSILEAAARYFEGNLQKNTEALAYLKKRGLTETTISAFRLGFASAGWRDLVSYLRAQKFGDKQIAEAGLIKKSEDAKEKDFYDRFRSRIMFPISDPSGRAIAFSGRIFEQKKVPVQSKTIADSSAPAKYINSPETPLFSKSRVLYGYDRARHGIRSWGFTILVEGQMDLLMSHQAGFHNTVALSGTSLTPEHVTLLSRLSDRLVLALDSDAAGLRASGKSAALTLSRGLDVKVARLISGKDPADVVAENPELWKKAIREATHIIDFYLEVIASEGLDERKFRQRVSQDVIPYVALIVSPIDRAHFVAKIAARLRLPERVIAEEVVQQVENAAREGGELSKSTVAEKLISSRSDVVLDRIIGLVIAEKKNKNVKFDVTQAESRLREIIGEKQFVSKMADGESDSRVVFEGEMHYDAHDSLMGEITDLLLHLKYDTLKAAFDSLMYELREKEKAGLSREAAELLSKCHELSKQIALLDGELRK